MAPPQHCVAVSHPIIGTYPNPKHTSSLRSNGLVINHIAYIQKNIFIILLLNIKAVLSPSGIFPTSRSGKTLQKPHRHHGHSMIQPALHVLLTYLQIYGTKYQSLCLSSDNSPLMYYYMGPSINHSVCRVITYPLI